MFSKKTGFGVIEYLNYFRVQKAKELLDNPASKVFNVGERVGVENSKYFSRIFKKYTGKTPSEYKNAHN